MMLFLGLVSVYIFAVTLLPCCIRVPTRGQNDQYGGDAFSDDEEDDIDYRIDDLHCCICDNVIRTRGHNPYPFCSQKDTVTKCCNKCKHSHVIPARLSLQRKKDLTEKHLETVVKSEINNIFDKVYKLRKEYKS